MIGIILLAAFNIIPSYIIGSLIAYFVVTTPIYFGLELILFDIPINILTIDDRSFNLLIGISTFIQWVLITSASLNKPTSKHSWKFSLRLTGLFSLTTPIQMIMATEVVIGTFFKEGIYKSLLLAWLISPMILLYTVVGVLIAIICFAFAQMIKTDNIINKRSASKQERKEPTF